VIAEIATPNKSRDENKRRPAFAAGLFFLKSPADNIKVLTRREFTGYPRLALFFGVLVSFVLAFVAAIAAANTHITIVDDRTVAESTALHVFGFMGMALFGGAALFLGSLIPKVLKRKGAVALVLDADALLYGAIKIRWPLIRETVVCKALGRSYVGIRTINDRAMAQKMDEALVKRVPYIFLIGLHYLQWRTQCSILIPRMQGISIDELQQVIEQYHATYRTPPAEISPAPA
jgi:hypothetical protein